MQETAFPKFPIQPRFPAQVAADTPLVLASGLTEVFLRTNSELVSLDVVDFSLCAGSLERVFVDVHTIDQFLALLRKLPCNVTHLSVVCSRGQGLCDAAIDFMGRRFQHVRILGNDQAARFMVGIENIACLELSDLVLAEPMDFTGATALTCLALRDTPFHRLRDCTSLQAIKLEASENDSEASVRSLQTIDLPQQVQEVHIDIHSESKCNRMVVSVHGPIATLSVKANRTCFVETNEFVIQNLCLRGYDVRVYEMDRATIGQIWSEPDDSAMQTLLDKRVNVPPTTNLYEQIFILDDTQQVQSFTVDIIGRKYAKCKLLCVRNPCVSVCHCLE
eukprot:c15891_g1_i1.p1 GENE.c15891_g1_i1~~c15891_g1_i1.p1  ORF type:complete len:334 (-),score=60.56 c15891_g1_i1:39-1040(-)